MTDNSSTDLFMTQNYGKSIDKFDHERSRLGMLVAGGFGLVGATLIFLTTPFILPALRKHCLPYVPATDNQISNLSKALKKYSQKGDSFLDIGSGDGRICRLAFSQGIYSKVHGVDLNYMLVLFSRIMALKSGNYKVVKYHHSDLWRFPLNSYDAISIFGVESMMEPLEKYLTESASKQQIIYACRFPFRNLSQLDEVGEGIDTVWVYKLRKSVQTSRK